jgi:hypothetical protein
MGLELASVSARRARNAERQESPGRKAHSPSEAPIPAEVRPSRAHEGPPQGRPALLQHAQVFSEWQEDDDDGTGDEWEGATDVYDHTQHTIEMIIERDGKVIERHPIKDYGKLRGLGDGRANVYSMYGVFDVTGRCRRGEVSSTSMPGSCKGSSVVVLHDHLGFSLWCQRRHLGFMGNMAGCPRTRARQGLLGQSPTGRRSCRPKAT